jgi:hypothetical protein
MLQKIVNKFYCILSKFQFVNPNFDDSCHMLFVEVKVHIGLNSFAYALSGLNLDTVNSPELCSGLLLKGRWP